MIKVNIKNSLGEITHSGIFPDMAICNMWISEHEKKEKPWGHKKDRWLREKNGTRLTEDGDDINAAASTRSVVLFPEVLERTEKDQDGNDVIISYQAAQYVNEYNFTAEYSVEVIDLSLDPAWISAQVDEKRKSEYPSVNDMIVALWEDVVEGRPEAKAALQAKREQVKQKYPKG